MLIDFLLPSPCLFCSKGAKPICSSCFNQFEISAVRTNAGPISGFSFTNYSESSAKLVQNIKETAYLALIPYQARLMASNWPFSEPVDLVPIPSSKANFRKRGFNHTLLLARAIARLRPEVQVRNILVSQTNRKDQVNLNPLEREANLADAFRVVGAMKRDKSLVLLDDVLTTGATIRQAAKALLEAGSGSVEYCVFTQTGPRKPSK